MLRALVVPKWKDARPDLRRIFARYPRTIALRDGATVTLRPLVPRDEAKLIRLFSDISYEELRNLHDNVSDPTIVRRWCRNINYERVLPIVGELDGRIVADATLHRRPVGPTPGVGRFRAYVRPEHRGRGLGAVLLREIMELARQLGLRHLGVELYEDQEALRRALVGYGFREAGRVPLYQRVIMVREIAREDAGGEEAL